LDIDWVIFTQADADVAAVVQEDVHDSNHACSMLPQEEVVQNLMLPREGPS
jgi:hypothetical protein